VTIPPAGITIGRVADNALVLVQDGNLPGVPNGGWQKALSGQR